MGQELATKMLAPIATCGLCFSGEPAPAMSPFNIFGGALRIKPYSVVKRGFPTAGVRQVALQRRVRQTEHFYLSVFAIGRPLSEPPRATLPS